jgi:hypothetical protein
MELCIVLLGAAALAAPLPDAAIEVVAADGRDEALLYAAAELRAALLEMGDLEVVAPGFDPAPHADKLVLMLSWAPRVDQPFAPIHQARLLIPWAAEEVPLMVALPGEDLEDPAPAGLMVLAEETALATWEAVSTRDYESAGRVLAAGDALSACALLERASRLAPDDAEILSRYATALAANGRSAAAAGMSRRAEEAAAYAAMEASEQEEAHANLDVVIDFGPFELSLDP